MKRCPQCERDYNDDSLSFCLDDGSELLFGAASDRSTSASGRSDEPPTAILHETAPASEVGTRPQIHVTDRTRDLETAHLGIPRAKMQPLSRTVVAITVAVAVAVVAGYLWYRSSGRETNQPGSKMTMTKLVTGIQGRPGHVAISPDGKYVAYSLYHEGKAGLWIRQVSQDTSLQIVPAAEGVDFRGATFSPDGEQIYFVSTNLNTDTLGSLYQIPVIGGREPKKLKENISSRISLSPDGRQYAFVRNIQKTGESTVIIANVDGTGEERKIGSRSADSWYDVVEWSPDGEMIACSTSSVAGGYAGSLVTIPVRGGDEVPVGDHRFGTRLYRMDWLKHGKTILASSADTAASKRKLYTISYPEGEVAKITSDLNEYGGVEATDDGSTLVTSLSEWSSRLWVALATSTATPAKRISNGRDDGLSGVAYLPDGRIVYVAKVNDQDNLWIMNADGTGNKQLTTDPKTTASTPVVSPDGVFIIFTSYLPDNVPHIWRVRFDGTDMRQLSTGEDYNPIVTRDGKWIVFHSFRTGKPALWKIPIEGGDAIQISDLIAGNPTSVSPDGRSVLCGVTDADSKTPRQRPALVDLESGRLVEYLDLPLTVSRPMFSRDGKSILYIDTVEDIGNVWAKSVAGGTARPLTKFTEDFIDRFDLSPDGTTLLMSRAEGANEIVLIKNFQ